ncbi:class I adenylate-forming enzyme family protein [Janibacter cremeus]|uniref:Acyl-CoA synthetase (AMP-forming)/AMP-acid ligase II n=1 Tax=Janibacter cremeus TaxID=1285192 RepID=A0A852VMW7_9MICO|nr:AMP-binding protein [Janibacter cremeus]NYF96998.1 acyl-CoA synthetase (AMP-forming)/AMP-acid ligase II [Janibacter cremeus]
MKPDLSLVDPLEHNLATRNNAGDVIVRSAALFPDRVAVVDGDREVTYRELAETVDRLGHALLGLGLPAGSPVAVTMMNSWRLLATYYACARAGLVCMPLNFLLAGEDQAWILHDSQPPVVVTDSAFRPLHEQVLPKVPVVQDVIVTDEENPQPVAGLATHGWQGLVDGAPSTPLEVIVDDRDVVQCLYTSGTTSRPKGVLVSHTSLVTSLLSNALVTRQSWGRNSPVMLVVLPMFHVTALNTVTMPVLMMGGTAVLGPMAFDPVASLDLIEHHRVTHLMMLPMMHRACVGVQEQQPRDLTSVTTAIYAMAPMPSDLLDAVEGIYPNADVILGSGQTEVVPTTVMQWPEHRHSAPDSWGPQSVSVLARTMGPMGEVQGPGETGEIVYRSPNVCSGYWNNPEANQAAFAHGWFHSSDVGHLDDDGVVWFTDRLKDIIKSGGENVSSVAVEAVLLGAPGVAECSVIGVPDERWGEAVCAVVVPDGTVPTAEIEAGVIAHAKASLAGFQVPKQVRVIEELPKTATGKIQKHQVRDAVR